MKVHSKQLFYSILFLLIAARIQADEFLYKQMSISEGFPPYIQHIYTEENGFVWISSKQGLGKFNGYELKSYFHDNTNPYSLPGNEIYQIEEDSLHTLWILTNNGTVHYQPDTDRFIPVLDENGKALKATALCKLPGKILLTGQDKLYQYTYNEKQVKTLLQIKTPSPFLICEMMPWDTHTLLCISQWQGITLVDTRNGERRPSPLPNEREITHVLIDHNENIWATSYNRGITCFDRQGNIHATYNTENRKLSHNVILCLSEHKGKIWAGTDGGGINIIHPQTDSVTILKHLPGDKNSLPINSIQCLFQRDGQEDTWAGSVKGGLINIRHSIVRSYSDVPLGYTNGLSEKAILSFFQEPGSDEIWIGTDGGGVNRFNPKTKQFVHYPATYGEKVVSLCRYSQQELLISLFSKGVFFFNKHTGQIRPFKEDGTVINQIALYGRKGINLYQDETESVLLLSSKIHRYYLNTGRIQQLSDNQTSIEGQAIPIGFDSQKTYLYDLKHIYAIDHQTNKIEVIYISTQKNYIECVSKDEQGIFWIGFADKIFRYDPQTQIQTQIDAPQLKNITTLICDHHQRIWIGTNEELFVWLDKENKLISLDQSDGAEDNEFLKKAIWVSPQGDIYMGGINGMLYIDGQINTINIPTPPVIKLTDIISNNQSYLSEIDKEDNNTLNLSFDNKMVTIKVMAYENNIFRKKIYRWYIDGQEESITDTKRPELILRSLTPGVYHVSASCSTKDGSWTTPQKIITISIPPVWYQTWWFNLLWILVAASLLIAAIIYLLRRKEERMQADLQAHKQKIYEEKVRFLININHELRTPLTLIYTPLNQLMKTLPQDNPIYPTLRSILKQSKRMKELLNMVLNLRKMEMSQSKLTLQTFSLNEWIKDIAEDFKYEEEEKHVTIAYELSSEIGDISFDQERHIIIITNLIVNAFKHIPEGSTIIIRTEMSNDKQSVRISVIDQGPGLQGVDTNKLFTRFYQGENEKYGSGIGLSYSKILVEMHKGKIGAYNNAEKGACFWYELPIHPQLSEVCPPREYLNILTTASENDECTPIQNPIDTKNYSCLFVDDNENIRQMIIETLKDSFKNLYIASNGKEALQIILKEIPDIVISDIMMPEMNGYELCRKIKEDMNINHIQVILLTARTDEQSHLDGYKTGADAYMEKPFEINSLLENVRNRLYLREQIKLKYTHSVISDTEKPATSADDTFIFKLNKVIIENMENEGLNVDLISQELGISRASLYNRLKALTGMGANEYVNKLRIEKAMELLRQTELNMTEIAEHTGFSTSRYFSTAFKKYTGITPTQYKENPDTLNNRPDK